MIKALKTIGIVTVKDAKNLGLFSKRKLMNVLSNLLGDVYFMQVIRGQVLKAAGARVAIGARIRAPIHVENPEKLAIGAGSFINKELYLDNTGENIAIGRNVIIGFRVSMTTSNHDFITRETISKPITIEDDVWIGACSTILPGVTVGRGAIVASGAVVTGDVGPYTVVGGIPARAIKSIELSATPFLMPLEPIK